MQKIHSVKNPSLTEWIFLSKYFTESDFYKIP